MHDWRLQSFKQNHLATNMLRPYTNIIHDKGAPLDKCFGFVDGTRVAISKPKRNHVQWAQKNPSS